MKIEENTQRPQEMIIELRKEFGISNEERTGYHVSDIVNCLRKSWFRHQPDYQEDLEDDSILYFVRGRSLHDMLEKLYFHREVLVDFKNKEGLLVIGTVDAVTLDGTAIEIKTTKKLWKNEPNDHHVQQLKYYMAMGGTPNGCLIYYEIIDNRLRVFDVTMTEDERVNELIRMDLRLLDLDLAIKKNDYTDLLEPPENNWECRYCNISICPDNNNTRFKQ